MKYYKFNGHRKKKCSWVARDPYKRCGKTDRKGYKVYTRCPFSCGECDQKPEELKSIGELCTANDQCISGLCKKGSCYASNMCSSLTYDNNVDFSENTVILVFIGSGFNTWNEWRAQAEIMHNSISEAEFFQGDVKYHPLFVGSVRPSFCHYNCQGIERLLCCDEVTVRYLTEKCFPSGPNVQSIVVHNDAKYGGAGYSEENIATTSIHKVGPLLIKHELGHSLFELGDEYHYTNAGDEYPNCATTCDRWSDLDKHFPGMGLCNHRGCAGGNKRFPSYCSQFDEGELNLMKFCQEDHQGYGVGSYISAPPLPSDDELPLEDGDARDSKLVYVHKPIVVQINLKKMKYTIADLYGPEKKTFPSYFLKYQVYGDFPDVASALKSDVNELLEVEVEYTSGYQQTLYFMTERMVSIPPLEEESPDGSSDMMDVMSYSNTVQLVLNKKHGWVEKITMEKYVLISSS